MDWKFLLVLFICLVLLYFVWGWEKEGQKIKNDLEKRLEPFGLTLRTFPWAVYVTGKGLEEWEEEARETEAKAKGEEEIRNFYKGIPLDEIVYDMPWSKKLG